MDADIMKELIRKYPDVGPVADVDEDNEVAYQVLTALESRSYEADLLTRVHRAVYESLRDDDNDETRIYWSAIREMEGGPMWTIDAVLEAIDWGFTHCFEPSCVTHVVFAAGVYLGQKLADYEGVWSYADNGALVTDFMRGIIEFAHSNVYPEEDD
jgi:hypothetical protein